MKFSILTIHPEILKAFSSVGLLKKAQDKKHLEVNIVHIRDFADEPHRRVDEKPYGGGAGMVMTCEPIVRAIKSVSQNVEKRRVVVLAAKGKKFTQKVAQRWLKYDHIVLICGRYEGIDERVSKFYADEEIRIGDYVLMGGEVASAVIVETVGRLIPGVLGNPDSIVNESFSSDLLREYAQFTRPPIFEGHEVPQVLLKGNHREIEKWRETGASVKSRKRGT